MPPCSHKLCCTCLPAPAPSSIKVSREEMNEYIAKKYRKYAEVLAQTKNPCSSRSRENLFREAVAYILQVHTHLWNQGDKFNTKNFITRWLECFFSTPNYSLVRVRKQISDAFNEFCTLRGLNIPEAEKKSILNRFRSACQRLWMSGLLVYYTREMISEVDRREFTIEKK